MGRTLYLVDGTYLLFRAYHSLPTSLAVLGETYQRNRDGMIALLKEGAGTPHEPEGIAAPTIAWLEDRAHDRFPTNAIRGLLSVVIKLIREEKPLHLGVAFDLPGPVHRDSHYAGFVEKHADYAPQLAGYKATRRETPVEIHAQFPMARILCARALGIPLVEAEGFEADDVMATLAHRARAQGFEVFIVTADKDLFQLVGDGISILNPHKPDLKRPSGYLLMDAQVVEREFGVPPSQVVDVLALMGDASDNIPGVPGIGEKGAKELIRGCGSIEACLEAAKEEGRVTRKAYRTGLLEHAALALFSKELATVRDDVPLSVNPLDVALRPPDLETMKSVFALLSFGGLLKDASVIAAPPAGKAAAAGDSDARSGDLFAPRGSAASPGEPEETPAPREVPGAAGGTPVTAEALATVYRTVLDPDELSALLPSILAAPRVAIDARATALDPIRADLIGISIAWEPGSAIYLPFGHRYLGAPAQPPRQEILRRLAPLLESSSVAKAGQNVKYDLEVLIGAGVRPAGFIFDTMIAGFVLQPDGGGYGLSSLAAEYLGETGAAGRFETGKQVPFDEVEVGRAAAWSGRDADLTLRLAARLEARLLAENLLEVFRTIDMPLLEVLVAMETAGVLVDVELLGRFSGEMAGQLAALRGEIHSLAGHEFNVDSPQQLAKVLFEEIGLKPVSRTIKSRVASTRDEDLEILAAQHALPGRVRDYRVLAKLRSTYVDALPQMVNPATGRVHTWFSPTGAATGRLSSSDPNLQNIPIRTAEGRKIRAAFVPRPGWALVSADYSQVELRVLAHLTDDPDLITAFTRGEDIHRTTAARIFNLPYDEVSADQRRASKTINFGILYGMGAQRLARELGIPMAEARGMIEAYFARFPRIRAYMDATIQRAEREGFVSTLFGRIRRFPQLSSTSRGQRQMAIRAAVNSTIQGTAADLMKLAMVRLHGRLGAEGLRARILIQVHDELVLEAPTEELERLAPILREAMEGVHPLRVPLTIDIGSGPSWLDTKSS